MTARVVESILGHGAADALGAVARDITPTPITSAAVAASSRSRGRGPGIRARTLVAPKRTHNAAQCRETLFIGKSWHPRFREKPKCSHSGTFRVRAPVESRQLPREGAFGSRHAWPMTVSSHARWRSDGARRPTRHRHPDRQRRPRPTAERWYKGLHSRSPP